MDSRVTMLRLHALCQSASGDAGQFKRIDNDIVETQPGHAPVVRFRCVTAKKTPAAVKELCQRYRHALDQDHIPPLIAIAALVLDFLCIHPFRDGNGRVSRLLTLLMLYQHDYRVGRYLSLERLVEEVRDRNYECLHLSSQSWHHRRHELTPWLDLTSRSFVAAIANWKNALDRFRPRVAPRRRWFWPRFALSRETSACRTWSAPVRASDASGFVASWPICGSPARSRATVAAPALVGVS